MGSQAYNTSSTPLTSPVESKLKWDRIIFFSLCQPGNIAMLEKLPGDWFICLDIRHKMVSAKLRRLATVTHPRPDCKLVPAREFRLECWLASSAGLCYLWSHLHATRKDTVTASLLSTENTCRKPNWWVKQQSDIPSVSRNNKKLHSRSQSSSSLPSDSSSLRWQIHISLRIPHPFSSLSS